MNGRQEIAEEIALKLVPDDILKKVGLDAVAPASQVELTRLLSST
jgi:hypothetical protein